MSNLDCKTCWSRTPEFYAWQAAIQRCTNAKDKRFRDYGGRGVRVCKRWRRSFKAFLADVGKRPSRQHQLDRIDNDGHYEPGNVRWATRAEQARNKRSNRNLTHGSQTKCLRDWAIEKDLPEQTLWMRLARGWPVKRALETPSGHKQKLITLNGKTRSLQEWADSLDINLTTLAARLHRGWPTERAFTQPIQVRS